MSFASEFRDTAKAERRLIDKEIIKAADVEFWAVLTLAREAAERGEFRISYTTEIDCGVYLRNALRNAGFGVIPSRVDGPPFKYTVSW